LPLKAPDQQPTRPSHSNDPRIFDWDGALVDSRDLNHRALEAALRDCGVALDPGWYWHRQGIASPDLLAVIAVQVRGRVAEFGASWRAAGVVQL
jgi:phosphoglycolate phosphatase-like HAD superfamily hydrolase